MAVFFMPPLEPDSLLLLREWMEKADADLRVAEQLENDAKLDLRIREITGFHCQQAAEKYLKAFLTRSQIEFPKTHDLAVLLALAGSMDAALGAELQSVDWLSPFGVRTRYPGEGPEMLPGDTERALELARRVKVAVSTRLSLL